MGLLLGDPTGIGPEVAAKLLARPETAAAADVVVIGDRCVYEQGRAVAGAPRAGVRFVDYTNAAEYPVGRASAAAGEYVLGSLRVAIEMWQRREIDAVTYAPLNKQAMKLAGLRHDDELHYFAELLGYTGVTSEINVCGTLWTSRVTSHVPLRAVADQLTAGKIVDAARLLHGVIEAAGTARPRIAIAALNPHAGEGGLLGTEEASVIGPAVAQARAAGIDASGPLPSDTVFLAARRGDYDGVVTMYHDQGQIAMKLLGFERGVTIAGGLPAVITTPAHGTAFDIVGKGVADPGAMLAAFTLACRLARAGR